MQAASNTSSPLVSTTCGLPVGLLWSTSGSIAETKTLAVINTSGMPPGGRLVACLQRIFYILLCPLCITDIFHSSLIFMNLSFIITDIFFWLCRFLLYLLVNDTTVLRYMEWLGLSLVLCYFSGKILIIIIIVIMLFE